MTDHFPPHRFAKTLSCPLKSAPKLEQIIRWARRKSLLHRTLEPTSVLTTVAEDTAEAFFYIWDSACFSANVESNELWRDREDDDEQDGKKPRVAFSIHFRPPLRSLLSQSAFVTLCPTFTLVSAIPTRYSTAQNPNALRSSSRPSSLLKITRPIVSGQCNIPTGVVILAS